MSVAAHTRRARRARGVLLVLAVAALPLTPATTPPVATAAARIGFSGGTTTVYRAENVCADPAPGQATCFAERLVARQVAAGSAAALDTPTRGSSGRGPVGGFTPAQVLQAYGVDPRAARDADAGDQVVAIVGAYHSPQLLAHLATFDARYGFAKESTATIRVLNGADGSSVPPATTDAGWAAEADLAVQSVRGTCPTCKILVVETRGPGSARLTKGADIAAHHTWVRRDDIRLPVSVITASYGRPETVSEPGSDEAGDYYHPGVVVLAAAGNSGWYSWDDAVGRPADDPDALRLPDVPASLPAVIGVGGTTLTVDPTGARSDEHVWDSDGNEGRTGTGGATGSGCSGYGAYTWELDAPGYDSLGCTQSTSSVDLAAVADPYTGFDVATAGGWATFGGTSLSTSLVAGMWALAGGAQGAPLPERTLYQHLAAGTGLHDVTEGGNGACGTDSREACSAVFGGNPNTLGYGQIDCAFKWSGGDYRLEATPNQCNARPGLDGPSGVGAPTGLDVFRPTNAGNQSARSAGSARSARRASASPVIR